MQVSQILASYYVLKPSSTGTVTFSADHFLTPGQVLVLGHASLGSYSEHSNTPPASAYAYVSEFVQDGQVKNVPDGGPIVIGPHITHIKYTAKADKCWVRTSFITQTFN